MRMIKMGAIDILKIMRTHPEKRTIEEILYLSYYLTEKVAFFKNEDFLDKEFMISVAEKVKFEIYEQSDVIMYKGDVGDKMYISIQGKFGIYLDVTTECLLNDPVAVIPEYTAIGERALKKDEDVRTATVMCLDPGQTLCLTLDKQSYQTLVYVSFYLLIILIFYLFLEIDFGC
jgi:hypothetical protein